MNNCLVTNIHRIFVFAVQIQVAVMVIQSQYNKIYSVFRFFVKRYNYDRNDNNSHGVYKMYNGIPSTLETTIYRAMQIMIEVKNMN